MSVKGENRDSTLPQIRRETPISTTSLKSLPRLLQVLFVRYTYYSHPPWISNGSMKPLIHCSRTSKYLHNFWCLLIRLSWILGEKLDEEPEDRAKIADERFERLFFFFFFCYWFIALKR